MIEQTNAFLSWALSGNRALPRVPCQRVDQGGFTELLSRALARSAVAYWWRRVLERD